jgi:hypothetical protein
MYVVRVGTRVCARLPCAQPLVQHDALVDIGGNYAARPISRQVPQLFQSVWTLSFSITQSTCAESGSGQAPSPNNTYLSGMEQYCIIQIQSRAGAMCSESLLHITPPFVFQPWDAFSSTIIPPRPLLFIDAFNDDSERGHSLQD